MGVLRRAVPLFLLVTCFMLTTLFFLDRQIPDILQTSISIVSVLAWGEDSGVEQYTSNRIIQDWAGYCVVPDPDGTLRMAFCNPNLNHTYSFTRSGQLLYDEAGMCVSGGIITTENGNLFGLILTHCDYSDLTYNGSYILHENVNITRCLTPVPELFDGNVTALGDADVDQNYYLALTQCHEEQSRFTLTEEHDFLEDRKALLLPMPANDSCSSPAYAISHMVPAPIELLPPGKVERCTNLTKCLTIVTKTARRVLGVLRFAESIRQVLGYDLPIVAIDDAGEEYSQEIQEMLTEYPLMEYIVGNDTHIGIGAGRTMGVHRVRTKYLGIFDDDTMFNEESDVARMVELLDTTDASLAEGKMTNSGNFGGFFSFDCKDGDHLHIHVKHGSCNRLNETVINFPDCVRCDSSSNAFIAKTADVLEVGALSKELKISEHKDFFLRLRAGGKKMAYCPGFTVTNARISANSPLSVTAPGYGTKRRGSSSIHRFSTLASHRWGGRVHA